MRHHFGDFLDREGGYWTITANRERYTYRIGDVPARSREVTIVTIGKEDEHWARALTLPNLEELTLHQPSKEQLLAVAVLGSLKRPGTRTRGRVHRLHKLHGRGQELVLEYVSASATSHRYDN
jgi:hypothetical protein